MSEDVNKPIGDNDDAFEREAAEGFAMLGSEEEIKSLKAETDAAFAQQLANTTTPAPRNWVWAVAAMLVIGLGVSIFTALQPDEKQEVSVVQKTQQLDLYAPAPIEELSAAQESPADKKEETPHKPVQTQGFTSTANNADAPMEGEQSFAMTSSSIAAPEPAGPIVAANRNAGADDREELAAINKQEKNLRLDEASAEADVVQKETKKAKAAPAPAKSVSAFETPRFITDSVGADGIALVIYPAGIKQLRKDAKALLKGIALMYPLDIQLVLQNDGTVQSAKVFSKAVMDSTVVGAAEKALLKLPAFVVQKPAGSTNPAVYNFTLP